MKKVTLTCDNCKEEIHDETSKYPNHVRYWNCRPSYSEYESISYDVLVEYKEPKDYCTKCYSIMEKALKKIK